MEPIRLTLPSKVYHIAQIALGFHMLKKQGLPVEIIDRTTDKTHPFYGLPVACVEYGGKKILYDLWDGYQNPGEMLRCLQWCDVYFKRSFSAEKNAALFPREQDKMFPLGFNYHVTYPASPINEPKLKSLLKPFLGKAPEPYFVPKVFEGKPLRKEGKDVRILFQAQLWDVRDPDMSPKMAQECAYINQTRIEIMRTLRATYGDAFFGGLKDTPLAREMAPELIVPETYTERRKYLKLVHSCDICIGSMGLHESIGWKTAEYIAAAKAIVNETFHYSVTGDFAQGKNYLAFSTAQECMEAVRSLVEDPEKRYEMQKANEIYYRNFLKPDMLVKHSLEAAEDFLKIAK